MHPLIEGSRRPYDHRILQIFSVAKYYLIIWLLDHRSCHKAGHFVPIDKRDLRHTFHNYKQSHQ
uniref:Uncharacterized protein n=1 Tax=Anguilla anguilla TaxID=7936 RepID=A0A0E9XH74_ANGAN